MNASKQPERRIYKDSDGKRLPGVTTVLGVLDKPALLGWAYRSGIKAVRSLVDGGQDVTAEALDALAEKPSFERERDAAADLGTRAHDIVAATLRGEIVPPPEGMSLEDDERARACAARALEWIKTSGAKVLHVEHALTSALWRVGGTFDLLLDLDGEHVIADLKTGKRVYDEVILQLAAYRAMCFENALASPMRGLVISAPIDGGAVEAIHIGKNALDEAEEAFGACVLLYRARQQLTIKRVTQTFEVTT